MKKSNEDIQVWPNLSLIGTKVRRGNSIRTIVHLYANIPGGVKLDSPIEGFYSWNLEELEKKLD